MSRLTRCWLIAVMLCALTVPAVHAQDPLLVFGGGGYGYGLGAGLYGGVPGYGYFVTRVPNHAPPPYFALNPPVYYNARITPRSYGSSPFPYGAYGDIIGRIAHSDHYARDPRWQMQPGSREVIQNPYYVSEEAPEPVVESTPTERGTDQPLLSDAPGPVPVDQVTEDADEPADAEERIAQIMPNPFYDPLPAGSRRR